MERMNLGRIILETPRLLLREFHEEDAAAFYVLGSDPEILRYTGDPGGGLQSVAHAKEILQSHALSDYRNYGFGRWACVDRATEAVIGSAGLKRLSDLDEVDLGFRFLPAYWGQGYATEAGREILSYGFDRLQLPRVIGLVDAANLASIRVLEKLGLHANGSLEYHGEHTLLYVAERATFSVG